MSSRRQLAWFDRRPGEEPSQGPAWLNLVPTSDCAPSAIITHDAYDTHDAHEKGPSSESAPVISSAPAIEAALQALQIAEHALAETEAALQLSRIDAEEAKAALVKTRQELADVIDASHRTITRLRNEAERELVQLSIAVSTRVVARELVSARELLVSWAREAIASSGLGEKFSVAISPGTAASLEAAAWGELVPALTIDPTLADGTCEVRDGGKVITVDAATRLGLVGDHLATAAERVAA